MTTSSALRFRICLLLPLAGLSVFASAANAAPDRSAAIVVDANTGKTLYSSNADARRYPASLTKMMTLYVLFEDLQARRFSLNSRLAVSAKAAAQAPSKLGVKAGSTIRVEDAILALTTKSANDVSMVIAENVAGSQSAFAARMNRAARSIGMNSSTFRNPNGLPDPGQMTTARDLVKLGQALQDRFPAYYKYFGARAFTYKGARIRNHNRLLGSVEGVDGIKTGYTRASGFNLVTNVRRGDRHIIAVVMGGATAASRDGHMRKLIATYLPAGRKGDRTPPLLVADSGTAGHVTPVPPELVAAADPDSRLPRARPGHADDAGSAVTASDAGEIAELAYADAGASADIVAGALAETGDDEDAAEGATAEAAEGADATDGAVLAYTAADHAAMNDAALRIAAAGDVAREAERRLADADGIRLELARKARLRAAAAGPATDPAIEPSAVDGRADTIATAAADWEIQIGAVPTEAGARALLDEARDAMGRGLAFAEPRTQGVERDGATIYRARFVGFGDKDQARAACAKLKTKSISCLAVPS